MEIHLNRIDAQLKRLSQSAEGVLRSIAGCASVSNIEETVNLSDHQVEGISRWLTRCQTRWLNAGWDILDAEKIGCYSGKLG